MTQNERGKTSNKKTVNERSTAFRCTLFMRNFVER